LQFLPPGEAVDSGEGVMKAKTYEDWQTIGYQVIKGEKSTGRDKNGKATFTRNQVEERDNDIDTNDPMEWHPGNPADYGDR
jgi:hypothetical protein